MLNPITRHFQKFTSMQEVGLIGIDFTEDRINLVQFEKNHSSEIALKSAFYVPYINSREELLSSPKILRKTLQKAIKENGFVGKNVVTSMPSSDVRILSINYSSPKKQDDSESLLKALKERVDVNLSDYVIDYLPVRTSDTGDDHLALVALVQRELVITYLELLRISGLNVEALEIRPAAVKRLIYSLVEPEDYRNLLVINFGKCKSYLTIISGRRLLLDTELNFGAVTLIEKMSKILDMPKESVIDLILKHGIETKNKQTNSIYSDENISETLFDIAKPIFAKLIEEINRILIFAASENHGQSISKVFLLGSITNWEGVESYLESKLKISVEMLSSPLKSFYKSMSSIDGEYINTPHVATAAGLAMRGLVTYE